MWPFKKKHKPKVLIDSLKKSYEKIDFEDESKMSKLHAYFLSVEEAFKKNRDSLNKQIETVMDKAEKHLNDKFVLEKIEQDSAKELRELRSKEDTRENRTRIRKLTAALHSAQFKLSQFDREERDYINTEKLLNSLYLDLEDCSNILEYMIGSLDRNLERVRAASFFTLSLSDLEENELENTQSATATDENTYKSMKRGILSKIPIPGKMFPKEPTVKTYPDTFEGRLEKLQDKLDAKAEEVETFLTLDIQRRNDKVFDISDSWSHTIKEGYKTGKYKYRVCYYGSFSHIDEYTLLELYAKDKEILLKAVKTADAFIEHVDKKTVERKEKEIADKNRIKNALSNCETIGTTVSGSYDPYTDTSKVYDISGVEVGELIEREHE